ncbi:hypothetical protein F511_17682 [Dorcoceras hygrometricum]|uniref:Uncharacterized protein n=1 Tax=Dorcoceras hygrometricum TaxID=472368 RepID=A0A2Z7C0T7_9LAMI|nr:hypothetical protein F511_17682 [Dorcoceras hygrometricum]
MSLLLAQRRIRIPFPGAPGSDQIHREAGTSRLAAVDLLIRSSTGNRTPSSVCTKRADEFDTNGISSTRDTASRGPTTIVTPKSQFRADPSDHDSIGYPRMTASGESSTMKHRLLHASGPHPIPPPNDPNPNEGSSIDHQVTIHLHAQNITMFPTNETWYFTSQMLVSSSGGLILILTVQSTRNVFRIHSDY